MSETKTTRYSAASDQKDQIVYDFVRRWIVENQSSPTFREIAEGLSISNAGAALAIHRLSQAGRVRFERYTPRSIRLVEGVNLVETRLPLLKESGFFGSELELVDFSAVFRPGSYCKAIKGQPGNYKILDHADRELGTLRKN